jgi:hypothetical protein
MRLRNLLRPYHPIRDRIISSWARRYMQSVKLESGEQVEFSANVVDLALLHNSIVKNNCQIVVEFGVGFSTLAIADALSKTGGKLFTIDASEKWLDNTRKKINCDNVSFVHSPVLTYGGHHRYRELPDVVPDAIYLDGPSKTDIPSWAGPQISSDILHYLPQMKRGAFFIIDGRMTNDAYLRSQCGKYCAWNRDDRRRRTHAVLESEIPEKVASQWKNVGKPLIQ